MRELRHGESRLRGGRVGHDQTDSLAAEPTLFTNVLSAMIVGAVLVFADHGILLPTS